MEIFYNPQIQSDLSLDEEESRHCIQVMRHQEADNIFVTDGKGKLFECFITLADKKKCGLQIIKLYEEQHRERNINIIVAPTKNIERTEWMLEKCTELGAASFTFIETGRSERKGVKPERLQKILVSAMKQSMNYFLPELRDMLPYEKFIKSPVPEGTEKFICYKDFEEPTTLFELYQKGNNVNVLIGPEGDFNDKEITLAKEAGYKIASLGKHRLRTETAGVAAVQQLMLK